MANTAKILPFEIELEVHDCPTCGVYHGVSPAQVKTVRTKGGSIYCPNGHGWGWSGNTINDRLEREKETLERRLAMAIETARLEGTRAQKEERKRKRIEKRLQNGVCPYCKKLRGTRPAHERATCQ